MSEAINDNQVRCMSRSPIFVDIGWNRTSVEVIAAHDYEHGESWALRIFDFTFSLHGPVTAIRCRNTGVSNVKRYLLIMVVLVSTAGGWLIFTRSIPPAVDLHSGQSISVAGVDRLFTVVVPHDLPPDPPLVFAFHGTGDTAEAIAEYSQLNALAAASQFILVYPTVSGDNWDTRSAGGDSGNADQLFFDHLLPYLVQQYKVNPERVYAIGMSTGGTFAQLLAATRSSQIAAVVAHSATPPQIASVPAHPSPTLLIVGDADPIFDSVIHHATKSKLSVISVSGLAHQWSVRHNAQIWHFLSQYTTPSP